MGDGSIKHGEESARFFFSFLRFIEYALHVQNLSFMHVSFTLLSLLWKPKYIFFFLILCFFFLPSILLLQMLGKSIFHHEPTKFFLWVLIFKSENPGQILKKPLYGFLFTSSTKWLWVYLIVHAFHSSILKYIVCAGLCFMVSPHLLGMILLQIYPSCIAFLQRKKYMFLFYVYFVRRMR